MAAQEDLARALAEAYIAGGPSQELVELAPLEAMLYEDHDLNLAKAASRGQRTREGLTSSTLTYGEILFLPFAAVLRSVQDAGYLDASTAGSAKFVDVGCGSGRPVFAAALVLDGFREFLGIEILSDLHHICEQVRHKWNSQVRDLVPEARQAAEVSFVLGDACELDWSDADLVFMNSTCFGDELLLRLSRVAEQLRPGAVVITTTRRLPSDAFRLLQQTKMGETWGDATLFVQQRSS